MPNKVSLLRHMYGALILSTQYISLIEQIYCNINDYDRALANALILHIQFYDFMIHKVKIFQVSMNGCRT